MKQLPINHKVETPSSFPHEELVELLEESTTTGTPRTFIFSSGNLMAHTITIFPNTPEDFEEALKNATTTGYTRVIVWCDNDECTEFLPNICTEGDELFHLMLAYTSGGKLGQYNMHMDGTSFFPACVFLNAPKCVHIAHEVYSYCRDNEMCGPFTIISWNAEKEVSSS